MQNKLIIFDMDGVLFNSGSLIQEFTQESYPGITKEEVRQALMGNFHIEIQKFAHLRRKETDEERDARRLVYAKNKSQVPMYAGMRELLEELKDLGITLGINTTARDRNCLPLLDRENIRDIFDFLGTADVSISKTEKFNLIKEKYGKEGQDILFITDTIGDLREAKLADVPTVAVLWGAHPKELFDEEKSDNLLHIAEDIDSLKRFIFKHLNI